MSNLEEIMSLQQLLNELVIIKNSKLHEGEILQLSQKLDKLIVDCYTDKEMKSEFHME